jgi:hypothetical protein
VDESEALRAARALRGVAELARRAEVLVHSLPDGAASEQVAREIAATDQRRLPARRRGARGPAEIAAITGALWRRFADVEPGADFTRIFPFVDGR